MKLWYTYIVAVKPDVDEILYTDKIPQNAKVYEHGNGMVRTDDVNIEESLHKFLYQIGEQVAFKDWYQEAIDGDDPYYPAYRCKVSKNIWDYSLTREWRIFIYLRWILS